MSEELQQEVEKTLLYIAEARRRAEQARVRLIEGGAPAHAIEALEEAVHALEGDHRQLMHGTLFAVPGEQERLTV